MNSDNLGAGPIWILGDRSHRSGPHQFLECLRHLTRQLWPGSSRVSRLPEIDSGRTQANVYNAVPTVPSVPTEKNRSPATSRRSGERTSRVRRIAQHFEV
jgi:hypothetical protein